MSEKKRFVEEKAEFIDEMAGFISYEAGAFHSREEGDANAKVDATAEKAIRFEVEKQKNRRSEIKQKKRVLQEHIKKEQSEIKKEKQILEEKKAEVSKNNLPSEDKELFREKEAKRISDREEQLDKNRIEKKTLSAEQRKELKKASAKLAVARLFQGKKEISKELAGKGGDGEDAFEDGAGGLNALILTAINPLTYIKRLGAYLAALLMPVTLLFISAAAIVAVTVTLLFSILLPLQTVGNGISNFLSIFTVNSDVFRNVALSEGEIDAMIEEIGCTGQKETLVRFALSKVGYPYSQPKRASGKAYDCSSLAYYAWKEAGVDISYGGGYPPTAAAEASMLSNRGKTVASEGSAEYILEPGDLVFYGGSDNGRYLGIYHVAIYIGNGMAVEALNQKYGVVLQTLRTKNAILAARPSL